MTEKERKPAVVILIIVICSLALFIGILGAVFGNPATWPFVKKSPVTFEITPADNKSFELDLVREDLQTYGTISARVQNIILTEIDSCSMEYKIPIGLLHSIFRVESEYKFNIDHPTVTIKLHGQIIKTHATGLGGVMWAIWQDSLKAHNIAQAETDLYLPDINIHASSYILSLAIKDALKNRQTGKGLLDKIIRNYYGAYSDMYMSKMERVTSDLWMKRITKTILKDFVKPSSIITHN